MKLSMWWFNRHLLHAGYAKPIRRGCSVRPVDLFVLFVFSPSNRQKNQFGWVARPCEVHTWDKTTVTRMCYEKTCEETTKQNRKVAKTASATQARTTNNRKQFSSNSLTAIVTRREPPHDISRNADQVGHLQQKRHSQTSFAGQLDSSVTPPAAVM